MASLALLPRSNPSWLNSLASNSAFPEWQELLENIEATTQQEYEDIATSENKWTEYHAIRPSSDAICSHKSYQKL